MDVTETDTTTSELVYSDSFVEITAIRVHHGEMEYSYAYKLYTLADHETIIISGDMTGNATQAYSENFMEVVGGTNPNILLHEVYSQNGFNKQTLAYQGYFLDYHTSPLELVTRANAINPLKLVLYHQMGFGLVPPYLTAAEVTALYTNYLWSGNDFDVITPWLS